MPGSLRHWRLEEMTRVTRSRTGLALSSLAIAFLLFDTVGKLLRLPPVVQGTVELSHPDSSIVTIGVLPRARLDP